jgi:hypothetical protein
MCVVVFPETLAKTNTVEGGLVALPWKRNNITAALNLYFDLYHSIIIQIGLYDGKL